jgi:hypothetical protein
MTHSGAKIATLTVLAFFPKSSLPEKINGKFFTLHARKAYGEVEKYFYSFLTLAPDGNEWSASRLSF